MKNLLLLISLLASVGFTACNHKKEEKKEDPHGHDLDEGLYRRNPIVSKH
jgi:hypothetical protein